LGTITYVIVCFSILVQGMTIGKFAKKMQSQIEIKTIT
jgi:CPA1 family monovalent cation:H+ antiporter